MASAAQSHGVASSSDGLQAPLVIDRWRRHCRRLFLGLCALIELQACNYGKGDIKLDPRRDASAVSMPAPGARQSQPLVSKTSAMLDAGSGMDSGSDMDARTLMDSGSDMDARAARDSGSDSDMDAPWQSLATIHTKDSAADTGNTILSGPPDATATPDATTPSDASPDAQMPPDAMIARSTGCADPEAGVDDCDGSIDATDPCMNGTYQCGLVTLQITGVGGAAPSTPLTLVTVDGYTFRSTQQGSAPPEIRIPTGRWLWIHTEAPDYWVDEAPFFVQPGVADTPYFVPLFSSSFLAGYVNAVGAVLDESTGFVFCDFRANIVGAGFDVGRPCGPSFVLDSQGMPVPSKTLIPDGGTQVFFTNVDPGVMTLTAYSPPNTTCVVGSTIFDFVARPKTVTRFAASCFVPGP